MKRLNNFKTFESSSNFLTEEQIRDIFVELVDEGYTFNFYSGHMGIYYFDFRKNFTEGFDFNTNTYSYGCQDLESMNKQVQLVFSVLEEVKSRLNSMDYSIGFEPEFSFSEETLFCITCHMSHKSVEDDLD